MRRGQKAKHLFPLSFITFLEGITSAFLPPALSSVALLAEGSLNVQCLGAGWPQQRHRGSVCDPATSGGDTLQGVSLCPHGIGPSAPAGLLGTAAVAASLQSPQDTVWSPVQKQP